MLSRFDPFRSLDLGENMLDWFISEPFTLRVPGQQFGFACDVTEDGEGYTLRAVLPGLRQEHLEISLSGQDLTIRAEYAPPAQSQDVRYLLRERASGRVERTFRFRQPLDADGVQASYQQGILTVRLPKAESVRARRIAVQSQPMLIEGQATPVLEEKTAST